MSRHQVTDGILTLNDTASQRIYTWAKQDSAPLIYNAPWEPWSFKIWTVPASLAVTEGILVSFFSSAY